MDAQLQADLQGVCDKDQVAFSVTVTPVVPAPETVSFTPTAPAV